MLRLSFLVFGLALSFSASAKPDQVIVVRHAERLTEPRTDPAITPDGVKRAELLAQMLGAANVQTISVAHTRV